MLFAFNIQSEAQQISTYPTFSGYCIIPYTNGYFQGSVVNGLAQGEGVYYYSDGTFIKGNYYNGTLYGNALFVTQYGYMTGFYQNGLFYTTPTANSPTYTNTSVKETIDDVYSNRPNNISFTNKSPEGYDIKRIDPESQMGRTLLGRYSGN